MALEIHDLLRVHTCAFNGRDLETFAAQASPFAPCFCDGQWVGEGPEGVRKLLSEEYARNADVVVRVENDGGEEVLEEYTPDGRERRGRVRIRGNTRLGRIDEMRIEHTSAPAVRTGVPEPGA